jgi:hypothetical protein
MYQIILAAAILIGSQPILAAPSACQTTYQTTVSQCALGLNSLEPSIREGAQTACVRNAKLVREACFAGGGGDTCSANCNSTYTTQEELCKSTYNPAGCTDVFCEIEKLQQRAACISVAVTALNVCLAGCL